MSELSDLIVRSVTTVFALGVLLHATEGNGTGERVTVTPVPVPSSVEIPNPLRGLYRWHDQDRAPLIEPSLDEYRRFDWRKLEPNEDQYDFHLIEEAAARAAAQGHKFAFRVCPAVGTQGCIVPQYLAERMPGAYTTYKPDGKTVSAFVPDWNSPVYLERVSKLLTALGKRFDGDPRISWVEIGLYGNWGEWHNYGFGVPPAKLPDGTSATKHAIVDLHVRNFPKTRLIMMTDDQDALLYALSLSPRIGIRRDSLGVPLFADGLVKHPEKWNAVKDRWKTAPFITEPIGGYTPPQDFTLAARQVREFHVSAVGNGNFTFDKLDPAQQTAVYEMGRNSGYRYVLSQISYPTSAGSDKPFVLEAVWSNVGCAPTYQPWKVTFSLREPSSGRAIWSGISKADLSTVFPATAPQPVSDSLALPNNLPAGHYILALTIKDPDRYYRPLALAMQGRQSDGSYLLGNVTVK